MERVFPVECFCIARQMLSTNTCMSTPKRAWQRMSLLRSPSANSLLLGGIPAARLTQGNSRGSRTVTQVWFGIAVATVLAYSPFETTRESFPDSRFPPRKPRDSARSHTWCDSDTGSRRQVGNMLYLGIGSISGIMHIISRLPRAARAVVVVAVLIAIWR